MNRQQAWSDLFAFTIFNWQSSKVLPQSPPVTGAVNDGWFQPEGKMNQDQD
jgi:hypothetical protein